MQFSVVVPFFNAARTINACIGGLLRQSLPHERFEILMVDNNSTDASATFVARHPRVSLLHAPVQGAYAARNVGVRAARGEVIAFTDPDCVPHPEWLARLADGMADARVMALTGRDRPVGRSRPVRLLSEYLHQRERFTMAHADPAVYHGHTNNMAARASLFAELGPFEERPRGSDTLFIRRVIERHGTDAVRYAPAAVVDHLELESTRTWLHKAFLYGRSGHFHALETPSRALTARERSAVILATVRAGGMDVADRLLLAGLLAAGVVSWNAGFYAAFLGHLLHSRRTRR